MEMRIKVKKKLKQNVVINIIELHVNFLVVKLFIVYTHVLFFKLIFIYYFIMDNNTSPISYAADRYIYRRSSACSATCLPFAPLTP